MDCFCRPHWNCIRSYINPDYNEEEEEEEEDDQVVYIYDVCNFTSIRYRYVNSLSYEETIELDSDIIHFHCNEKIEPPVNFIVSDKSVVVFENYTEKYEYLLDQLNHVKWINLSIARADVKINMRSNIKVIEIQDEEHLNTNFGDAHVIYHHCIGEDIVGSGYNIGTLVCSISYEPYNNLEYTSQSIKNVLDKFNSIERIILYIPTGPDDMVVELDEIIKKGVEYIGMYEEYPDCNNLEVNLSLDVLQNSNTKYIEFSGGVSYKFKLIDVDGKGHVSIVNRLLEENIENDKNKRFKHTKPIMN
jgi:hypothetical protein